MKKALFLILLLLIPDVLALGIAPARKTLNFEPNGMQELDYRIYNSDRQSFDAKITLSPELEEIATVEPEIITFTENDVVKQFKITIQFEDEPPEALDNKITISASPSGQAPVSASVQISAKVSIITPTGAVVTEETTDIPKTWPKMLLGILIGALVIGNIFYFMFGRSKTSTPPTLPKKENSELDEAHEIEEEIDHLRHMR